MAFRSHYGSDAFYCRPGIEGAHEKDGVEHEGGRFRRSHLVPVPDVDTLADLNARIEQIEVAEDVRHIDNLPMSVGFDFEAPLLAPLPFEEFDVGLTLTPKVDKTSRITVRQNKYPVPPRFIGQNVRVTLRADEVWVFDRHEIVVRHPRLAGPPCSSLTAGPATPSQADIRARCSPRLWGWTQGSRPPRRPRLPLPAHVLSAAAWMVPLMRGWGVVRRR